MRKLFRLIFVKIPLAIVLLSLVWVVALKILPVVGTPLMLRRMAEFSEDKDFKTRYEWVSLDKISPYMMKTVIASEDNLFATHNGFALEEVRKVYEAHILKGKKLRGCSTISQQTAKNVFTSGRATWLRKGAETYFTFLIEKIWGKERIMEVYLNVAEMGPGVYGIEAAAKYYWNKSADKLTLNECALLTACFPDPLHRNPAKPTRYLNKRSKAIISLTRKIGYPDWISGRKN